MSHFEVTRSTTVNASPERVHALVNDFHEWTTWSPWEGIDPAMRRTYSGPDAGVGARYAWSGNRKAGEGSMEITSSAPERIGVELAFTKPWKATNQVDFLIVPAGAASEVTWRMTGEQKGLAALFGKVYPMDKLVGGDFERGLAQLKSAAEA